MSSAEVEPKSKYDHQRAASRTKPRVATAPACAVHAWSVEVTRAMTDSPSTMMTNSPTRSTRCPVCSRPVMPWPRAVRSSTISAVSSTAQTAYRQGRGTAAEAAHSRAETRQ